MADLRGHKTLWLLFSQNRTFTFTWVGTLLSSFSGFYLMLHVATLIFDKTRSNLQSGGVFAVSWLLPALLVPITARILERYSTQRVLVALMLLQTGAILAIFGSFHISLLLVYTLLAIRGYFSGIELTARQILLKNHLPNSNLAQGASLIATSNYLGMILGGLGSALGTQHFTQSEHLLIVLSSALLAGIFYRFAGTSARPVHPTENTFHYFSNFFVAWKQIKVQGLTPTVIRFFVTNAVFQGYHNVARTAYSVDFLGLPSSFISHLQVLTTCAVVGGSLFVATLLHTKKAIDALATNLPLLITATFLLSTVTTHIAPLGLGLYATYIFFFEVSFMIFQNKIITNTSHETMTLVLTAVNSVNVLFLGLSIFALGAFTDRFGIRATNVGLVLVLVVALVLLEFIYRVFARTPRGRTE